MRIIHISDIHLTRDGSSIWGEDTQQKFVKAIDLIKEIQNIDAILVSGDISNDGSLTSYEFADNMFSQTGIPTYWCLGNHDNLELLRTPNLLKYCKLVRNVEVCGWNIILLNSVAKDEELPGKNRSRGILNTETITELKSMIIRLEKPTMVVLHHPALEIGGWQDKKILKDREAFRHILESSPNIQIVLSGHVHEFSDKTLNRIRYSTAAGLGFAFSGKIPNYELVTGEEGFCEIIIKDNDICINNILLSSNK